MTIKEIIEIFKDYFDGKIVNETDEKIVISIHNEQEIDLNVSYFNQVVDRLENQLEKNETEISNGKYFEILAKENSRVFLPSRYRENSISDNINNLEYSYGDPSDEYILYILSEIGGLDRRATRRFFDPTYFRRRSLREPEQQSEFNYTIFDVLRKSLPRIETIKIKSDTEIKKSRFEQLMYSYLFSLSYNLSLSVYPLRYFDEFLSPLRVGRLRRLSRDEIDFPKRTYINDLILHYQKGISTESLDHQYLSFYHILEHFFEKIYNEDLINKLRDELTLPGFSYKRKTDIEKLVKIVQKKLRYKNEEFQINELEALELVLRKYIDNIEDVKTELNSINPILIDYFKNTEVPFSKGNRVNFENEADIYKNLSKRIYFTRNSIVHSKETEKEKYIPFKNDKDLINQIYLMRIIAEKVIISNSKEI